MRTFLDRVLTTTLFLALIYVIVNRAPQWIRAYKKEGSKVEQEVTLLAMDGTTFQIPDASKKLLVFWATWCGPCDVELKRIQSMVNNGKLNPRDVVAIATDKDIALIQSEAKKRGYTFTVAQDSQGAAVELFEVMGTPTLVFLNEDRTIDWTTMGLSPTLELRISRFFSP